MYRHRFHRAQFNSANIVKRTYLYLQNYGTSYPEYHAEKREKRQKDKVKIAGIRNENSTHNAPNIK